MSNNKSTASSGGIGFATALTLIFIVLRLIPTGDPAKHQHIINWSWWWVLSPIWISWGLALAILIVILLAITVAVLIKK